jgi:hypothetical protein
MIRGERTRAAHRPKHVPYESCRCPGQVGSRGLATHALAAVGSRNARPAAAHTHTCWDRVRCSCCGVKRDLPQARGRSAAIPRRGAGS